MVKANSKPVLVVESMYEMLCRIHAKMNLHAGQKQLWLSMNE
ncbi:4823_t:CDS:1, partial [Funneliformis geosporum]